MSQAPENKSQSEEKEAAELKSVENDDEIVEDDDCGSTIVKADKSFPPEQILKITTLNLVSINSAWKKGLKQYIESTKPDIFCVQETKLHQESKPSADAFKLQGYKAYFNFAESKKGYSGTGIYTKIKPISVKKSEGINDKDGRCITMEFSQFYILNTYVVNLGENQVNYDKKINHFNPEIEKYIQELSKVKPVIWTGDLNVAHNPIDIYTTEGMSKIAGYTDAERKWFDDFMKNNDYVDVFRELYPKKQQFSFFSFRGNMRAKRQGWRIDYFMMPRSMIKDKMIVDCIIENADLSDHEPVTLILDKSMVMADKDVPVDKTEVNIIGKKTSILNFFAAAAKK
ncbi:DNA-(apurinic or apyrimidinic site) lyase [Tritrichomonas musculus]|uniref:DNA-(Apurinic or apyrimidinic site) lyase n=1 Tax=Tritrichomonas musculus TaxID=1915356 RepID=A0ABR2HD94_9EUKA